MEKLKAGAAELGLPLAAEQAAQFQAYYQELVTWNTKVNLTAIVEYGQVQVKHFLDSLTVAWALKQEAQDLGGPLKAIDIGAGAGLPGVALKIALPGLRLTLLDSVAKKITFLRHLIAVLGLKEVEVVAGRAEDLARLGGYRESFDLALARGVSALPVLAELGLPFLKVGGILVAHKGAQAQVEAAQAGRALDILGGQLRRVREVAVGGLKGRSLVIIDKVAPTPSSYPRRPGLPRRRPL